ncbi:D-ribose ABC transporter substrate-binding protein [Spirochaetia bacterium]|nr:D-ribose ABC transporter substrate-binding protein [Spirochaetia bacterium]
MKKGVIIAIVVSLLTAGSVFAAGGKDAGKDQIKIGFSIGDLSNPIWITMVKNMEKKAKELGVQFICKDYKQNIATQIDDIENFLTMGCQVIIIHAMDYEAALPLVREATGKGVKVISYDVDLPGSDAFCGVDNTVVGRAIGQMTGEWINKNVGGKGVVGIFGYPTILAILERENGMKAGLRETAPNARIVGSVSAGFAEEGVTEAENFMQSNPDINAIMGINDGAILGAYEAFNAAGWGNKNVGLFGCDAVTDAMEAIDKDGVYKGTIFLSVLWAGEAMIENSIKMARGEPYEKKIITPPIVITRENVKQYLNVYK